MLADYPRFRTVGKFVARVADKFINYLGDAWVL